MFEFWGLGALFLRLSTPKTPSVATGLSRLWMCAAHVICWAKALKSRYDEVAMQLTIG